METKPKKFKRYTWREGEGIREKVAELAKRERRTTTQQINLILDEYTKAYERRNDITL